LNIEIRFGNRSLFLPSVIINDGLQSAQLRHVRWVQLIALLAWKRLRGQDGGNVSISELKQSLAFRRVSLPNIARFYINSLDKQPAILRAFVRNSIHLPGMGPFRLRIDASHIKTDPLLLNNYISSVFGLSELTDPSNDLIWQLSCHSLNKFDLQTARYSFSNYLDLHEDTHFQSQIMQALGYINLAIIEYILQGNGSNSEPLLQRAEIAASVVADSKMKILLQAYILQERIWMTPVQDYPASSTIRSNQNIIDILANLPVKSSDKSVMLAGRHYHNAYTALQFGSETDVKREFTIVRELYHRLADSDKPKILPYEPGSLRMMQLQMDLVRIRREFKAASSELIAMYEECMDDEGISPLNTLSAAEWITYLMIRDNQQVGALEFITDAMIKHAVLHETALYSRMTAMRNNLKTALGCSPRI